MDPLGLADSLFDPSKDIVDAKRAVAAVRLRCGEADQAIKNRWVPSAGQPGCKALVMMKRKGLPSEAKTEQLKGDNWTQKAKIL